MKSLRHTAVPLLALTLLGLQAGLAASPASAVGSIRYASPTGTTGQTCATPATACNIEKAINSAATDDEIVLAPGSYTPASALMNSAPHLNVHGTPGQPRPVVNTSTPIGLVLNGSLAKVSDLVLNHAGTAVALYTFSSNVVVERVEVHASANNAVACNPGVSGVFRDSLCVATGSGGKAVEIAYTGGGGTMRIRNVTGIAAASGTVGFATHAGAATPLAVDVRNSIFQGSSGDVVSQSDGGGGTSTVTLQSSNFDIATATGAGATVTAAGTGTNQLAPPVFADTTSYHQATTSPTIDKGVVDADLGTADLDGDARVTYTAPDIGVDEYRDVTPPDTVLDKTPKKRTFSHRAKFLFHATEAGATLICRMDKKPAVPCTASFSKRVRKAGKHTFSVVATDVKGNVDATPATYTWKVKKKRPHHQGHH